MGTAAPRARHAPATCGTSRNHNKSMFLNYLEKSLYAQLLLEAEVEHFSCGIRPAPPAGRRQQALGPAGANRGRQRKSRFRWISHGRRSISAVRKSWVDRLCSRSSTNTLLLRFLDAPEVARDVHVGCCPTFLLLSVLNK